MPHPIPHDADHLTTGARKLWDTLWSMGVFTQLASNIKFTRISAYASCVNGALGHFPVRCGGFELTRSLRLAIPENRGKQKMEIQFFSIENNSMSTSFGKKLVTLR